MSLRSVFGCVVFSLENYLHQATGQRSRRSRGVRSIDADRRAAFPAILLSTRMTRVCLSGPATALPLPYLLPHPSRPLVFLLPLSPERSPALLSLAIFTPGEHHEANQRAIALSLILCLSCIRYCSQRLELRPEHGAANGKRRCLRWEAAPGSQWSLQPVECGAGSGAAGCCDRRHGALRSAWRTATVDQ